MQKILQISFFLMVIMVAAQAQTKSSIACYGKEAWLRNGTQAVKIGQCGEKQWRSDIRIGKPSGKSAKLDRERTGVLRRLKALPQKQFKPAFLPEGKLEADLPELSAITLKPAKLPRFVVDFLKPHMEFIISRGMGNSLSYSETVRFMISVPSDNPTLNEMLDEVRKVYTDREDVKEYGAYYYFLDFNTWKRMDSNKTAAELGLKNGDRVLLTFDYAKYANLPPGVR